MRERTITISFTAKDVGAFNDKLSILSDDAEFPELVIPLKARFDGVPKLQANPEQIAFGYVDVNRNATRALQLTNHGTWIAPLAIKAVRSESAGGDQFSRRRRRFRSSSRRFRPMRARALIPSSPTPARVREPRRRARHRDQAVDTSSTSGACCRPRTTWSAALLRRGRLRRELSRARRAAVGRPVVRAVRLYHETDNHLNECYWENKACPTNRTFERGDSWGDESADYTVKISRKAGVAPTCTPYTVQVTND